MKKLVAKEIEALLPIEKFDPNLRSLHTNLCESFAEDLIRKVPVGHEIYEAEGRALVRKKSTTMEGLDSIIEEASTFNFQIETMPDISDLLEESLHPAWNKLINDKFITR